MNGMEFVVIILALSIVGQAIRSHYRAKEFRRHEQEGDSEVQKTLERLSALEERIRVLERIVTDERYELRQRFKDL